MSKVRLKIDTEAVRIARRNQLRAELRRTELLPPRFAVARLGSGNVGDAPPVQFYYRVLIDSEIETVDPSRIVSLFSIDPELGTAHVERFFDGAWIPEVRDAYLAWMAHWFSE
jgi:hypothetical protein